MSSPDFIEHHDRQRSALANLSRPAITILQAVIRYAVPIAIGAFIIGGCSGIVPPTSVSIILLIGLVVTVACISVERPVIAGMFAIGAFILAFWFLRPVIDVRASSPGDREYAGYYGIDAYGTFADDVAYRNIAVATGTFTLQTRLSVALYHVKSGEISEINAFTAGRSRNRIGDSPWLDMELTLALGDRQSPEGRITQVGSTGQTRGFGRGGPVTHDVQPHATMMLPGRLTPGARRVVYIEGDRGFHAESPMTVERFAQTNNGNYLVVELELH
jgi:hypothetical protein